jgi:hypothetical protein
MARLNSSMHNPTTLQLRYPRFTPPHPAILVVGRWLLVVGKNKFQTNDHPPLFLVVGSIWKEPTMKLALLAVAVEYKMPLSLFMTREGAIDHLSLAMDH